MYRREARRVGRSRRLILEMGARLGVDGAPAAAVLLLSRRALH